MGANTATEKSVEAIVGKDGTPDFKPRRREIKTTDVLTVDMAGATTSIAPSTAVATEQKAQAAAQVSSIPAVEPRRVRIGGRQGRELTEPQNGSDLVFKAGSTGASVVGDNIVDISGCQKMLKQMGCVNLEVDGKYGKHTERAVRAVQKALGLAQTGEITVETYKAIDAVLKAENQHQYAAAVKKELNAGSEKRTQNHESGKRSDSMAEADREGQKSAKHSSKQGIDAADKQHKGNFFTGLLTSVGNLFGGSSVQTAHASEAPLENVPQIEKVRLSKQDKEQLMAYAKDVKKKTGDDIFYNSVVDMLREQSEFDHGGPLQGLFMGQKNKVMSNQFSEINQKLAEVLANPQQLTDLQTRRTLAERLSEVVTAHNVYQAEKLQKTDYVANKTTGQLMAVGAVVGAASFGVGWPLFLGAAGAITLVRAGIRFAGRGTADYGFDSMLKDAGIGTVAAAASLAAGNLVVRPLIQGFIASKFYETAASIAGKQFLKPLITRVSEVTVGQAAGIGATLWAGKYALDQVNKRIGAAQTTNNDSSKKESELADANPQ